MSKSTKRYPRECSMWQRRLTVQLDNTVWKALLRHGEANPLLGIRMCKKAIRDNPDEKTKKI